MCEFYMYRDHLFVMVLHLVWLCLASTLFVAIGMRLGFFAGVFLG